MPARRPGTVTAAAVMAIVYGCLGTICGLFSLVVVAAEGAMGPNFLAGNDPQQIKMQKDVQQLLNEKVPAYKPVQVGAAVFGLGEGIIMLIGGIAILKMTRWARPLTIACCFVIIATTLFQAVYQVVFVMPAVSEVFEGAFAAAIPQGAPQAEGMMKVMRAAITIGIVVGLLINLGMIIYLIVIISLLSGRRARLAFAGLPFDSEEDQRRERTRRSREDDDREWGETASPHDAPINPQDDWRIR